MITSATQTTSDVIKELRKQRQYTCIKLPTLPSLQYLQKDLSPERQQMLLALYKEICTTWRTLLEIRFRLLTFVPAASAVILIALFTVQPLQRLPYVQTGIALFGLFVTIGLSVYNTRNVEMHDDLMKRACKIENELGIDTGQFHGRLKPAKKMPLIPFPKRLNNFTLTVGKTFRLQLPEHAPARVLKNATLQLPKNATLQLLDDIFELRLPPGSTLQLPENATLQLTKNSSFLLLKGDRLQLHDDSVLQLSGNAPTHVLKNATVQLPKDCTWRQLKNSKLSFSKTPMRSLSDDSLQGLFIQSLHLPATSSVQLLDEPALYWELTCLPSLPKNLLVELPNKRLLRTIAVNHDVSTKYVYRTVLTGWLVAILVTWLMVLIPILLK